MVTQITPVSYIPYCRRPSVSVGKCFQGLHKYQNRQMLKSVSSPYLCFSYADEEGQLYCGISVFIEKPFGFMFTQLRLLSSKGRIVENVFLGGHCLCAFTTPNRPRRIAGAWH